MLVTVPQLVDRMSGISLDPQQRADAERVLAGVQRALERYLNRPIEGGTRTERVLTDSTGFAVLYARPLAVTSVTIHYPAPVGDQATTWWTLVPGGISLSFAYIDATVVYTAAPIALNGDDLADMRRRILDVAARVIGQAHDDVLTASDLTTRNERAEGSPWWTPAELEEFSRLRRRMAL